MGKEILKARQQVGLNLNEYIESEKQYVMKLNNSLSGKQINECIMQTEKGYSFLVCDIMRHAHRIYRMNKLFNKTLRFGDVLKAVWTAVKKLVTTYRTAKTTHTKISGGDFKTTNSDFGFNYKLVN